MTALLKVEQISAPKGAQMPLFDHEGGIRRALRQRTAALVGGVQISWRKGGCEASREERTGAARGVPGVPCG